MPRRGGRGRDGDCSPPPAWIRKCGTTTRLFALGGLPPGFFLSVRVLSRLFRRRFLWDCLGSGRLADALSSGP